VTVDAAIHQGGDAAIALRPLCTDDRLFLLAVYASTGELELAALQRDDGDETVPRRQASQISARSILQVILRI
jgi:hypothetical protein